MLVIGSLLLGACGSEEGGRETAAGASDPALFMVCAESRGALLELEAMAGGRKPVDTSSLAHGAGFLDQLADRVSAADDVRSSLVRWKEAVTAWNNQLSAIPPRIENGRLIEPDTSELDRALLSELQAISQPLADWVDGACEGVRL
jgi:hypothetical protein